MGVTNYLLSGMILQVYIICHLIVVNVIRLREARCKYPTHVLAASWTKLVRNLGIFQHLPPNTLPETNSSPLEMDGWKMYFLLGWPIFRGYVSFRDIHHFPWRISDYYSINKHSHGTLQQKTTTS